MLDWGSIRTGRLPVAACMLLLFAVGCGSGESASLKEQRAAVTIAAVNLKPQTKDFVIAASNSVRIDSGVNVAGGDVMAGGVAGPFLADAALTVASGAKVDTTRSLIADSVQLATGAVVGDVQTNHLSDANSKHGKVSAALALPQPPPASPVTPGTVTLSVPAGKTVTGAPGRFASVSVGTGAKLRLSAGNYDVTDFAMGSGSSVETEGKVELHIANRFSQATGTSLGPAATTSGAASLRVEVSGHNGTSGTLTGTPASASIASGARLTALLLVPNGTLTIATGVKATGAFFAKDIAISSGATIAFQGGFVGPSCTETSCDDHNPCTVDTCTVDGCAYDGTKNEGATCDDSKPDTVADVCKAGLCTGMQLPPPVGGGGTLEAKLPDGSWVRLELPAAGTEIARGVNSENVTLRLLPLTPGQLGREMVPLLPVSVEITPDLGSLTADALLTLHKASRPAGNSAAPVVFNLTNEAGGRMLVPEMSDYDGETATAITHLSHFSTRIWAKDTTNFHVKQFKILRPALKGSSFEASVCFEGPVPTGWTRWFWSSLDNVWHPVRDDEDCCDLVVPISADLSPEPLGALSTLTIKVRRVNEFPVASGDVVDVSSVQLWEQKFVIGPTTTTSPTTDSDLLHRFAPVLAMQGEERYLPESVEAITNSVDALAPATFDVANNASYEVSSGLELRSLLANQGSSASVLKDSNGALENFRQLNLGQRLDESRPTLYGRVVRSEADSAAIYLQYWALYSFDFKKPSETGAADHSFDREVITLRLKTVENEPVVESVVFGSHLDFQSITHLESGNSWEHGRVRVPMSRLDTYEKRVVAYVARGTHAFYPTSGTYEVKTDYVPRELVSQKEPTAGSCGGGGVLLLPRGLQLAKNIGAISAFDYELKQMPDFGALTSDDPQGFFLSSGYLIHADSWLSKLFPIINKIPPHHDAVMHPVRWVVGSDIWNIAAAPSVCAACTPQSRRVCDGATVRFESSCGETDPSPVETCAADCVSGFCPRPIDPSNPPADGTTEWPFTGQIIDSLTGLPIGGAQVDFGNGVTTQTSATGWYGVMLTTGAGSAAVSVPGYASGTFGFTTHAGGASSSSWSLTCRTPDACPGWNFPPCSGSRCTSLRGHFSVFTGEPHMRTFDGLFYDMQGVGEFVLARSIDDDFEVQARTRAWQGRTDVSANSAVAARANGDRVGIYNDGPGQWRVLVNGQAFVVTDVAQALPGGARLVKVADRYVLTWPDGSQLYVWAREKHLEINVVLAAQRSGRVLGLNGNSNDQTGDDLVTSSGVPVAKAGPFRAFYDTFVDSWRVTNETSLFVYGPGQSTATFTDRSLPTFPTSPDDLPAELRSKALETCQRYGVTAPNWLQACILDVALTGDDTLASSSAAAVDVRDVVQLARPPKVAINLPVQDSIVDGAPVISGTVEASVSQVRLVATVNGAVVLDKVVASGSFNVAVPLLALTNGQAATAVISVDAMDGNSGRGLVRWTSQSLPCCSASKCPSETHPDADGDGIFDACEDDADNDGVANASDNCPGSANPDQSDVDQDLAGDACDADIDGDTLLNANDNCPKLSNRSQADLDKDSLGDPCDPDADGDTVPNVSDNCALIPNTNQADADGDHIGDACDGLDVRFHQDLRGGGIAAAGIGLAGRGGHPRTSATISLRTVPEGAEVVDAGLYWATIGASQPGISFGGKALNGLLVGHAGDTCWSRPQGNFAYRLDVRDLVTGNGDYVLSGFPSQASGIDGQGASLVVAYRVPTDLRMNTVVLAENIVASTGPSMQTTLTDLLVPNGIQRVRALNIVGDGQSFADRIASTTC